MDLMLAHYIAKRCPLAFFYILDITSLASYIIYYANNKMIKNQTNEPVFLRKLNEEL